MDPRPEVEPLTPTRHAGVVLAAAAIVGIGVATGPEAARSVIALVAGALASGAVAHFGWLRRERAWRLIESGFRAPGGRIVEREDLGRVVFELPAEGIEPWLGDAWVIAVSTLATVLLTRVLGAGDGVLLGFLVALYVAMGLRLRASAFDRIRIDVGADDWIVESMEGGRAARRAGRGMLLPELSVEALSLWSSAGRVGVLRGELEAKEREWLADRLAKLLPLPRSPAADAHDEVHDGEPDHDRQDEQAENTK